VDAALLADQHINLFQVQSASGKTRLVCCTPTLREATQWIAFIDIAKVWPGSTQFE